MRTITAVLLALLGMALTGISADAGPWCANYLRGVSNCGYSSSEQCWATVRGVGNAFCAEPLPGDGLRDVGWKLEYSQPAEALSAQLLREIFPATVRLSRFRQRDFSVPCGTVLTQRR